MNLVFGRDAEVCAWVAGRIPHVDEFGPLAVSIGIERDGEPVGGVVYHEYRGNDIQMSCASTTPKWLQNCILRALFRYPFEQLGCGRVTAFAPSGNRHTCQFLERLGFVREGVMRRGFEDDDCAIYGMLKEECKWIKERKNG